MQAKQIILTSILALAAAGAMADDSSFDNAAFASTLTRAQVKADVLKARKAGELIAAGEGYQGPTVFPKSDLSRSVVMAQVLEARAHGELLAAGDILPNYGKVDLSGSTLTRPAAQAQGLAANIAGERLPAGELLPAGGSYRADRQRHEQVASKRPPFQSIAKVFRRDDTAAQ